MDRMEGVSGKTDAPRAQCIPALLLGWARLPTDRSAASWRVLKDKRAFLDIAYQYAIDPSLVCRTDAMFLGLKSSQSVLIEGVCNVRYD
jgi:hypothetical protein